MRHRELVISRWVRPGLRSALDRAPEANAALDQLALYAFGEKDKGILRLETSGDGLWQGRPREIGHEPNLWTAMVSSVTHPGASPGPAGEVGAERANLPFYATAREELSAQDVDEALLVDAKGRLVEGTRSNLIFVNRRGQQLTPPLGRGPVRAAPGACCSKSCRRSRGGPSRRGSPEARRTDRDELGPRRQSCLRGRWPTHPRWRTGPLERSARRRSE